MKQLLKRLLYSTIRKGFEDNDALDNNMRIINSVCATFTGFKVRAHVQILSPDWLIHENY